MKLNFWAFRILFFLFPCQVSPKIALLCVLVDALKKISILLYWNNLHFSLLSPQQIFDSDFLLFLNYSLKEVLFSSGYCLILLLGVYEDYFFLSHMTFFRKLVLIASILVEIIIIGKYACLPRDSFKKIYPVNVCPRSWKKNVLKLCFLIFP